MGKFTTAMRAVELAKDVQNMAGAASDFRAADKSEMGRQAGRSAYNQGTETGKEMGKTWLKTFEVIPRFVCRGLQFIFALIAIGFYGNRVHADNKADDGFSPEWLYAIFVGGLASVSALLFVLAAPLSALPFVGSRLKITRTYRAFGWDFFLFVLWLVVFGIFASIFLPRGGDEPEYKGASTGAMKVAVWIDLVNVVLWFVSGLYGAVKVFLGEKVDSITSKAGDKLFTKKAQKDEEKGQDYAESV